MTPDEATAKAREVASQNAFASYEQGMCERGSGLSREQSIGVAVALYWVRERIAQALLDAHKETVEACVREIRARYNSDDSTTGRVAGDIAAALSELLPKEETQALLDTYRESSH